MSAPGPGLLEALQRLDVLLAAAVEAADAAFGPEAASDPYRGLVLGPEEITRLLSRPPGTPLLFREPGPTGPHGPVLERLAAEFGLTALDLDLLVVAAATEIDLRYERLYGYLQDDVARRRPSVDLALNLLCADAAARIAARTRIAPDAPLRREVLLHVDADPAQPDQPLPARSLRVDGQVLRLLLGESTLDPRLAGHATVVEGGRRFEDLPLDPSTRAALPSPEQVAAGPPVRLYLSAPSGAGPLGVARALASAAGRPLLVVRLAHLRHGEEPPAELVRIAFREARFRELALLVDGLDAAVAEQLGAALTAEVARSRVPTMLAGPAAWAPVPADGAPPAGMVVVPFPTPGTGARRRAWRDAAEAAGLDVPVATLDALAAQFRADERHIGEAVASAARRAAWRGASPDGTDLAEAARTHSGHELAALARPVPRVHGWDDLVLPADTAAQLHEVVDRVRGRARVLDEWGFDRLLALGSGTCALFAGPSGTGKTMAAGVLAAELGLDLYAVDLATVVSKYIGETEKNLKKIFEAARSANAVLFFDEADAVFGKRSEVRDAHDRYANVEIAYLLQKMEEYDGLAILATNLRENIDDAFLRRLHFVVEFPVPEEAERERMWRAFVPPQAPADALDYPFLARQFRLPGGSIKNIVVSAAYLAGANGGRIGMGHVLHAVRREHQKIGRVLSPADVGDYAAALGEE